MAYRLRAGDTGPVQQSPVTCGSACLTVARMLVDPLFASWMRTGAPQPAGLTARAPPRPSASRPTSGSSCAAPTACSPAGHRPNLPWPRRLGTPPWGARARARVRRRPDAARCTRSTCCAATARPTSWRSFDTLVDVVAEGEPALLYVGNALSPRHVVLVLPGDGDRMLDVYDPATGRVDHLRRDTVVRASARPQRLGRAVGRGAPTGLRTVRSRSYAGAGAAPA